MPLEAVQSVRHVGRRQLATGDEERPEVFGDDELGAVDELGRVRRLDHRHTFTPSVADVGRDVDEQDVPMLFHTEAGSERSDEVEGDPAEFEGVWSHGGAFAGSGTVSRLRGRRTHRRG